MLRARNERGVSAIIFALTATILLGVGAIAVDVGRVYAVRADLQGAADRAAVAAAAELDGTTTCTPAAIAQARKHVSKDWPRLADNQLTSEASVALDGTPAGGTIECTGDWKVRVTAPTARVDYGLARAVTSTTGGDVPARAEAGIFSPKKSKIMPAFAAGAGLLGSLEPCTYGPALMFSSPDLSIWEVLGIRLECRIGLGNFGSLRLPRAVNVNQNDELALNIAAGPDFTMTRHPQRVTPWTCSAADSVVSEQGALQDGSNCLDTLKGYRHNAAQQGLIDGIGGYPGLLNRPTSAQCKSGLLSGIIPGLLPRNDLTIRNKQINNDRLECFLKVNISLSAIASPDYAGPVVLDPTVMDSPRFFWAPVFGADIPGILDVVENLFTGNNSKGYFKIVDFRPGFIQGVIDPLSLVTCGPLLEFPLLGPILGGLLGYSCNGLTMDGLQSTSKLQAVQVFFFSERALPKTADVTETKTYLGAGPKIIRLTD